MAGPATAQTTVQAETAFSPEASGTRPIAELWSKAIGEANDSIKVTFYSFTLDSLRDALREAKRRKPSLDVRAVLDRSQRYNCDAYELHDAGIAFRLWVPADDRDLMHHKFLLVDSSGPSPVLVTGSANFTVTGVQYSHENQTLFRYVSGDRSVFDQFEARFERMWAGEFPTGRFEPWEPTPGYCGR